MASFYVVLWSLMVSVFLAGCGVSQDPQLQVSTYSGPIMGTTYNAKIVVLESAVPIDLDEQILQVLEDIDQKMSTYKPDSELNRFNRAGVGENFPASSELIDVLALSRKVYDDTDGAFDPTVGPLVDLWGFGPSRHQDEVPPMDAVQTLLSEIGYSGVVVDSEQGTVTKTKRLSLDLSAVAKGYAADQVGKLLLSHQLENFMVEVGGEMALSGRNDRGIPWQIAIEKPDSTTRAVQQVVSVTRAGVATSGDYRNYFEKAGTRYSHTLDPRTGFPIKHALASVTVITESSGLSDALATAFMVMGTEATLKFAEAKNIAVYTLSKSGDEFAAAHSSAFNHYLSEEQ